MKIKIVSVLVLFLLCSNAFGETTEGIKFFHGSWEEAKTKAKEENKIIFIDFYTQWCGPCFNMAKKVFILPEVGSFYNDKFICLKIDAESNDGAVLAKQYVVQSYPTYAFINPENEKLVHRSGGRKSAEDFIALGKAALNPQMTSEYILSEYNNGNRSEEFMIAYVRYMASIYKRDAVISGFDEVVKNGGKLTDPKIWELYRDCISGYDNPYLKEVSDHYTQFVDLFGKKVVDNKLAKETTYCSADFMAQLCDFEGKAFNMRLKKISDQIYYEKDYSKAIVSLDALIADRTLDKQKVIDRLKFMVRLNRRYGSDYPDEWFYKCVEYLRYIAYNDVKRDDVRIHFDYALALEMMAERVAKTGKEIPEFLKTAPKYGKEEYSSRPAELKMKPKYQKNKKNKSARFN
ncbi:thioredoxin family protein [Ancylomarina salipaludis]|uniref:Thioredoxin family protein n=1 Tax=Ancylomarina salipaludis TaxID=2501299 RepID=A0A4Q1JJI1_9BACT|nr:thioredoxin family protein [Ancylomarina salipaludis]RXQ91491.1 thioredoxin family protein [Ancylomarina salipaludis]